MQNRFKSWVLWASIASFIVFVLKTYFGIVIPQVDVLVNMILSVMVLFGVVNNPTDSQKL
jgi:uncharacterized membrane protein